MWKILLLISMLSSLKCFAIMLSWIIVLIGFIISFPILSDWDTFAKEVKTKIVKYAKRIFIFFLIMVTTGIIIPNKEDMYLIYGSSYIKKENYDFSKKEIKESIDYLFKKIDEVKGDK